MRILEKKGLAWLSSAKTNSQAIVTETMGTEADDEINTRDFNSATKIVKNFENPKIEE